LFDYFFNDIAMTTLFIKSLLTSLFPREGEYPSLGPNAFGKGLGEIYLFMSIKL